MQPKPNPDLAGLITVYIFLAVVLALFVAVILLATKAKAADSLAYCALYARVDTMDKLLHGPIDTRMASYDYIEKLAIDSFNECQSVIPAQLPLAPDYRALAPWIEDMQAIVLDRAGTSPAGQGVPGWEEACAAEYISWDASTGTVVRRGSPERVRCPCGVEVVCGE